MDPDQVADAGVQHDDLGGSATSADGCCDDSWARALLRRGWGLSRKAAIAGVAATAAPVVAPSLLVLSLAGVALSLPFAAYLASLAVTDRLMGALLPAPRTQPYHTCDLEDDEFLDASEAPGGEAPVFDHWCDTESDAIIEENESFESLPLSREPRFFEEPVPPTTDVEDKMVEGEFPFRELGHESLVLLGNSEQEEEGATMEDIEYITMEALPWGFDVSGSAVPVPVLSDEDSMVQRVVEGPRPAKESVQELFVSDNKDKTEDDKRNDMEEMESSLSLGVDISELSDFPVPMSGNEGIVVQREGEAEIFSGRKSGQDSHLPHMGDKAEGSKTKEEIPLHEINVSESSVQDETMLQRNIEGDIKVEMVVEEVTINTNPITGEVVADEQVVSIATALPESQSLQASSLVTPESEAMAEAAYVDDTELHDEGGVSSVVSVVTVDNVAELVSSRSPAVSVSGISDDMKSVKCRPDSDRSSQTTGYTLRNKEFRETEVTEDKCVKTEENKTMDDKVPTRSMAPQYIGVSRSPLPDDQSKIEDEVTVETVLEEVRSDTGDLVTQEVVAVQLNIITSESESPPLSGHVAQELQTVSEAPFVDEIQGSTVMEHITKDLSDITTEGSSSRVPGVTVDDGNDLVLSRSTPHASARDSASSVEGTLVFDNPHQTTGVEYKPVNEGFGRNVVADKDNYTEEQLREQLDTLRTITGYRHTPSMSLEAELVGLYIFVGVEPPVRSRDDSDLHDLNTKLRFLKSIIGVE